MKNKKKKSILNKIHNLNKTILVDCENKNNNWKKKDLIKLSKYLSKIIKNKNLILFLGNNDCISLAFYYGLIQNKQLILMLDNNSKEENIEYIINRFKPNYIFTRENKIKTNKFINYKNFNGYSFLKRKKKIKTKINKDLALLLTTSGSLKKSKYVKLTYKNIFSNAVSINEYLKLKKTDSTITTLPISYSYGLSVINIHLFFDRTIYVSKSTLFEKKFWDNINKNNCTNIALVPFHFEILEKLKYENLKFNKISIITVAGGKLSTNLIKKYAEYFKSNNISFFIMYGQTEASPRISYINLSKNFKPKSVGKVVKGGKITIKNNLGNVGEILYQGKNVFTGYAKSIKDCKILKRINILKTGDLGYFDKEGDLFIVGRKNRDIKIHGVRTNLDLIENEIKLIDANICLYFHKDKIYILYLNKEIKKDEILNKLYELAKIRKDQVQFYLIDSLPRLNNNKIDYKSIKKLLCL